jgi:hypothetical protein
MKGCRTHNFQDLSFQTEITIIRHSPLPINIPHSFHLTNNTRRPSSTGSKIECSNTHILPLTRATPCGSQHLTALDAQISFPRGRRTHTHTHHVHRTIHPKSLPPHCTQTLEKSMEIKTFKRLFPDLKCAALIYNVRLPLLLEY